MVAMGREYYDVKVSQVLRWVGTAWLVLIGFFLLVGYGGVIFTADSVTAGLQDFRAMLGDMSIRSGATVVFIIMPGIIARMLASRLAKKSR
ncbi:MAG: hypothetical protein JW884_06615 [Deltaproteobacteria bacterium]|nr:hypothetical protein [Deltaproteobacteria bacterium]